MSIDTPYSPPFFGCPNCDLYFFRMDLTLKSFMYRLTDRSAVAYNVQETKSYCSFLYYDLINLCNSLIDYDSLASVSNECRRSVFHLLESLLTQPVVELQFAPSIVLTILRSVRQWWAMLTRRVIQDQ